MKILWTTNCAIGKAETELLGLKSSGGWMNPFLEILREHKDIELVIVTSAEVKDELYLKDGNVVFYVLPGGRPINQYDGNLNKNIAVWESLLKREMPQVIHIWGSESSMGIAAVKASKGKIPAVLYIQGLGRALVRYCEAGIDRKTQHRIATLRDYIRRDTIWKQYRYYDKIAQNEEWIINKIHNVIIESHWAEAYCRAISNNVNAYFLPLPISNLFFHTKWSKKYEKHTIMCPLSYGPIKGHHILLNAIGIVKRYYPNVKLKIPGNYATPIGIYQKLKKPGYQSYLNDLIKENGLEHAVEYMGVLSSEEMAENMSKSNIFVMCSVIENHSSTLKEAMAVGIPCIASNVGGISEYVVDGETALLYRYEEYEVLARLIIRLFEDNELCQRLSANASKKMQETNTSDRTIDPIVDIYNKITTEDNRI